MPKFSEHTARLFDTVRDIFVDVVRRFETTRLSSAPDLKVAPEEGVRSNTKPKLSEIRLHPVHQESIEDGATYEIAPTSEEGVRYFCGMRWFGHPDEVQIMSITNRSGINLICAGGIDAGYFNTHGQGMYADFDFGPADIEHPIKITVRALKPGKTDVNFALFSQDIARVAAA